MKKIIITAISFLLLLETNAYAGVVLQNRFIGVRGELLKNIDARFNIKQQTTKKNVETHVAERLYDSGISEINKAIQPYGYFRAKIASTLQKHDNKWLAIYTIKLNDRLKITKLEISTNGEAKNDEQFQQALLKLPIKQDHFFSAEKYNDAKQLLFDLADRRGYLSAKIQKSVILIDRKKYTCEITIIFDSGPRYYFGSVSFTKTPFSDDFLRRFLQFKTGEHFSGEKLQDTQTGLNDSDLFSSVMLDPEIKQSKELSVPVKIHLTPRSSKQYTLGAGFGTDTGPRILAGVVLRNFNRYGHRLNAAVKLSQKQGNAGANYIIPGRNPATDRYDFSAESELANDTYGNSRTLKLGASYLTNVHTWQQTIKLSLMREWFKVQGQQRQISTLFIPSINWSKSMANNTIRPTSGYRINLLLQGALKHYGSNASFIQALLQAKTILPLAKRNRILLVLRGEIGYTAIHLSNTDQLPLSLRFAAGGASSIRGYGYQDIGPGNELVVASSEIRFRVKGNWYFATFYDAGVVGNYLFTDLKPNDAATLHQGAGIGVVWLSPIGTIELTYALALDSPNVPYKIQFSMGTEL